MNPRALAFISVGIVGFLVQTAVLAVLALAARWPVPLAAAVAVEAAVVTNFFWHERWTWRDRCDTTTRWLRLARFHMTNGVTSFVGNTVLTVLLANGFGLSPIAGNAIAVAVLGVVNFVAADRWVFVSRQT